MKVTFAHFDEPNDVSGVSTWLRRLVPSLRAAGWDVSVDLFSHGSGTGANARFFHEQGIPFRTVPRPGTSRDAIWQCLRWLKENPPDVYVPNCIVGAHFAARWAREQGIATVGVLHSDDPFYWGIVEEFVTGAAAWRLSVIVPVSEYLYAQVRAPATAAGVAIARIGYGTPVSKYCNVTTAVGPVFRLVYLGRLIDEQKRITEVTHALCAATRCLENVEAWIVGDGPERAKVASIISEAALGARVKLIGRVEPERVTEVLAQCHAFVLLSDYEGLPVSLLEAMAIGLVPICLEMRSGISEVVVHERNGLIVKNRGADFLAAFKTLALDPAYWSQLSTAARQTIRESFSHEKMVAQWLDLFATLTRGRLRPQQFAPPRALRLPPRNQKFGSFDTRPPLWDRLTAAARIWLGARRRQWFG